MRARAIAALTASHLVAVVRDHLPTWQRALPHQLHNTPTCSHYFHFCYQRRRLRTWHREPLRNLQVQVERRPPGEGGMVGTQILRGLLRLGVQVRCRVGWGGVGDAQAVGSGSGTCDGAGHCRPGGAAKATPLAFFWPHTRPLERWRVAAGPDASGMKVEDSQRAGIHPPTHPLTCAHARAHPPTPSSPPDIPRAQRTTCTDVKPPTCGMASGG